MLLPMVLNSLNSQLKETYAGELLKCNEKTKEYGLVLTAEDAIKIIEARSHALQSYGRVELGIEVTGELIEAFCTSTFINEENYIDMINELNEIFYYMKNETEDKLGDEKLIGIMKEHFEEISKGSIDQLKSTLEAFAQDFRKKAQIKELSEKGDE